MTITNELPGKAVGTEEPNGQKPTTNNVEWWFYWDGSIPEKEKKARTFFAAAKSAMVNEFQNALPGCLVLEYEDLAQAHYHVIVFFEQYPVGASKETPDSFVECVVKYGGPKPDNVSSYARPTTTMEKWLQHIRQASLSVPPGSGGYRIADTYANRKEAVPMNEKLIQATCIVCGIQTEDSKYSRVVCKDCLPKVVKLRYRMKLPQPPGVRVEYIFLVGFGRMPGQADVSALGSADREARAPHLHTSMLSGSMPQTEAEIGLITAELVGRDGQKRLGHEVDWEKVTYEGFQDLLLIKFWA